MNKYQKLHTHLVPLRCRSPSRMLQSVVHRGFQYILLPFLSVSCHFLPVFTPVTLKFLQPHLYVFYVAFFNCIIFAASFCYGTEITQCLTPNLEDQSVCLFGTSLLTCLTCETLPVITVPLARLWRSLDITSPTTRTGHRYCQLDIGVIRFVFSVLCL